MTTGFIMYFCPLKDWAFKWFSFYHFFQGGFEYKRAIVDSIIAIIEENAEAKEAGLAHLCEFIEDCEHTVLATRILHLLGREGPRTPQPSKYIRFIYNRIILENPAVRAGSITYLVFCNLMHVAHR
jgi:coatomer protein complex subunit gamma